MTRGNHEDTKDTKLFCAFTWDPVGSRGIRLQPDDKRSVHAAVRMKR